MSQHNRRGRIWTRGLIPLFIIGVVASAIDDDADPDLIRYPADPMLLDDGPLFGGGSPATRAVSGFFNTYLSCDAALIRGEMLVATKTVGTLQAQQAIPLRVNDIDRILRGGATNYQDALAVIGKHGAHKAHVENNAWVTTLIHAGPYKRGRCVRSGKFDDDNWTDLFFVFEDGLEVRTKLGNASGGYSNGPTATLSAEYTGHAVVLEWDGVEGDEVALTTTAGVDILTFAGGNISVLESISSIDHDMDVLAALKGEATSGSAARLAFVTRESSGVDEQVLGVYEHPSTTIQTISLGPDIRVFDMSGEDCDNDGDKDLSMSLGHTTIHCLYNQRLEPQGGGGVMFDHTITTTFDLNPDDVPAGAPELEPILLAPFHGLDEISCALVENTIETILFDFLSLYYDTDAGPASGGGPGSGGGAGGMGGPGEVGGGIQTPQGLRDIDHASFCIDQNGGNDSGKLTIEFTYDGLQQTPFDHFQVVTWVLDDWGDAWVGEDYPDTTAYSHCIVSEADAEGHESTSPYGIDVQLPGSSFEYDWQDDQGSEFSKVFYTVIRPVKWNDTTDGVDWYGPPLVGATFPDKDALSEGFLERHWDWEANDRFIEFDWAHCGLQPPAGSRLGGFIRARRLPPHPPGSIPNPGTNCPTWSSGGSPD